MTNTEKVQKIIADATLSPQDKSALLNLFAKISGKDEEELFGLLSSDPSWLQRFVDNYKNKQTALDAGDGNVWEKIIQDEEAQLAELDKD